MQSSLNSHSYWPHVLDENYKISNKFNLNLKKSVPDFIEFSAINNNENIVELSKVGLIQFFFQLLCSKL